MCGTLISMLKLKNLFLLRKDFGVQRTVNHAMALKKNPEGNVGTSIIKWDAPPNVDRGYFHMGWQLFVIMMLGTPRLVNKRLPTLGGALHIMTSRLVGASNHPAT